MPHHAPATRIRRWHATLIVAPFFAAVAGAAVAGWWYARESPPHQGPIVLISVAGLRADQLAAYGAVAPDAPAIDALAAESVVFERAYTHSPLTLPANVSLLAGQLPFEHGVRDEAGFALKAEARSLAELLRNRGFQTGAAVSSFVLRRESGVAQGFSFFDAERPEAAAGAALPPVERDGGLTADAADRWVRSQRGQRFFLFMQVADDDAEAAVTRVVRQLKDRELYDGATILLTADGADSDTVASLDSASLRVPLIVKQPDGEGAGRRVAEPVQHIDILPTVLDLVRAPLPSGLRGRSLRAVLDDEEGVLGERPLYAESLAARFRIGGHPSFALTLGDYRYVRGGREEVMDLAQQRPAVSPVSEPPQASDMRTSLDRMLDAQTLAVPEEIPADSEDEYAALGYLGGGAVAAAQTPPIDPDEELALLEAHRAAAVLVSQKKYAAAIDSLRAIARRHPDVAVVHYQLGRLLARSGRLEEAAQAFRTTAALQPDNPHVRIAVADAMLRRRQPEEARDHARVAVALAEHQDARARLAAHEMAARVALAQADGEAAQAHAAATQADDRSSPLPHYVRARLLYDAGTYDEALTAFEAAAAAEGESGRPFEDLHWYLGDTLAKLDRYADAEMQFREELRAFPRSLRAYSSLATLYRASNRERHVEEVIDELLAAAPTAEGYATAARLWTVLGERERAAALRADARTRFRGDPSLALFERGR